MFLDRTFAKDKPRIDGLIDYYSKVGNNYQLLLFPEGTDKCPKATARSKQFAERSEKYNEVEFLSYAVKAKIVFNNWP